MSIAARFVSRPIEIEAFKYVRQRPDEWPTWLKDHRGVDGIGQQTGAAIMAGSNELLIAGNHSTMRAAAGDYVIYRDGKVGVMKAAQFEDTYEALDTEASEEA